MKETCINVRLVHLQIKLHLKWILDKLSNCRGVNVLLIVIHNHQKTFPKSFTWGAQVLNELASFKFKSARRKQIMTKTNCLIFLSSGIMLGIHVRLVLLMLYHPILHMVSFLYYPACPTGEHKCI